MPSLSLPHLEEHDNVLVQLLGPLAEMSQVTHVKGNTRFVQKKWA